MSIFELYDVIEALIVVKAYPQPSRRYGESVCIAAVRTDTPEPLFCRLYPVDFRGLPPHRQFHKYQVIRCLAKQPRDDSRPESLCPVVESIEVVDHLRRWRDRWPLLEPLIVPSMCELQELERQDGTSLGLFAPAEVLDFKIEATDEEWDEGRAAALQQQSLLPTARARPLEKIPFSFSFVYRCAERTCRTHTQQLIDWEICELYRKLRGRPIDERLDLVREKWLNRVCGSDRVPHFFAGNLARHRHSFVLLGAAWPALTELRAIRRPEPLALF